MLASFEVRDALSSFTGTQALTFKSKTAYLWQISRWCSARSVEIMELFETVACLPGGAGHPLPGGPDAGRVRVPKAHEDPESPRSGQNARPLVAARPGRVLRPGHPGGADRRAPNRNPTSGRQSQLFP